MLSCWIPKPTGFEVGFGVDTQAQDMRPVFYNLHLKVAGEHHEKLQQIQIQQVTYGDHQQKEM